MLDLRESLSKTRMLALVAGLLAGCGGGGSSDAAGPATGADAAANPCIDVTATASLCPRNPSLPSVTDLSGTWVLETVGAQVVTTPAYAQPFHIKSVNVLLAQVVQTGSAVTLSASYCDRIQHDDPANPAKVVLPDAWRLTPAPLARSGTFAPDDSGQLTLTLPTLIEVFGAILTDPACEALPVDANDPRLFDTDGDGFPGITVDLSGLISGTLRSVQRQATALRGMAVAADRVEGGMAYESDQSVVASDPPSIRTLYTGSQSSADPTVCSSSFVMVRVPTVADAGVVDCDWVRANEGALPGLAL
jgi:hypothetical protein